MGSRYKWVFILVFITILMIALAYLVSEKLMRHLDEQNVRVGVILHPAADDEIKVNDDLCFQFKENNPLKNI